ncbi:hypothetical protein M0D21_10580 [Aquimarina sp. D1M17]|uniref:hypothetical protein n=1 Tax=Aquimarina acroporae TaxID=2937283 RepID=UPI0020BF8870|nr:hypothetical protein [Aquimarina acroporae]MCK8522015.1 hypothetical protein [Aquimarina acroporae]
MKATTLLITLFLSVSIFGMEDDNLTIQQEGLIIEVVDFEEGDKLKLFEVETGDHILSKSYSRIDLSQLPIGSYLLENNRGKSIVIDRLEEELMIDGAVFAQEENFLVEDAEMSNEVVNENTEEEFVAQYLNPQKNVLDIQREGDVITVVDFAEGDKLKLFEVKDTVHVLSKTTNVIDLSQLPVGVYLLENSNGDAVVVEKYTETQNNITDL